MPLYEYQCQECEKSFEVEAAMQAPAPKRCPFCYAQSESLQKRLGKTYGFVKGRSPSPAPKAPEAPKDKGSPTEAPHVCAQYCDHHKKI